MNVVNNMDNKNEDENELKMITPVPNPNPLMMNKRITKAKKFRRKWKSEN